MLPKETHELEEYCLKYGYYLNKMIENIKFVFTNKYKDIELNLLEMSNQEFELSERQTKKWLDIVNYIENNIKKNEIDIDKS